MSAIVVWEDRDVRFDIPVHHLKLRAGEQLIDLIELVEDTKGNGGEKGTLTITNLRLIWCSRMKQRVNLSIGFFCVMSVTTRTVNSKLRGVAEALYILTKANGTRFEFIFTNLIAGPGRLFKSVMAVFRAYSSSRMYREVKLRGAIIQNGQLRTLPKEQIMSTVNGVWNLSSDQGNLGTFIITNVRLVWFANMNELFNISLPYLQMVLVKIRDSKFGTVLVVETSEQSGGYLLGFRIDPEEKLKSTTQEIASLYSVYSTSPIFGVNYFINDKSSSTLPSMLERTPNEDVEIDNTYSKSDILSVYLTDDARNSDGEIVFCKELGLAIEKPPEGLTLANLWEVLPST